MILSILNFAVAGASCKDYCGFACSGWKGEIPLCDIDTSWPVSPTYKPKTTFPLVYTYLSEAALCDGRRGLNPNVASSFYISSSCTRPTNDTIIDLTPQTLVLHDQNFSIRGPATLRGTCPLFTFQSTNCPSIIFQDITFECITGDYPIVFHNTDETTIVADNIRLSGGTHGLLMKDSRRSNINITNVVSDRQPCSILQVNDSTVSIHAECTSLQFTSIYTTLGISPIFDTSSTCTIKSFNRDVTPIQVVYADVSGAIYSLICISIYYLTEKYG